MVSGDRILPHVMVRADFVLFEEGRCVAPLQLKAASRGCHHSNALGERSGGWGAANGYLEASLNALSMSFWTRMSQSSDRSGATIDNYEKRIMGQV